MVHLLYIEGFSVTMVDGLPHRFHAEMPPHHAQLPSTFMLINVKVH
jgi:hypothetical protein